MKRKLVVALYCLTACWNYIEAQSIEQIKAERDKYIWGEGSGITLKQADQEALSLLISQISTNVESSFSSLYEEMRDNGKNENLKEVCKSVIKTYSNATLRNTERIFSDDALIITGKYVKVRPNEYSQFKDNRIIKYNKQTKQQYIKNLKYSFGLKEYINIKFEQSEIRKAGKGGNIFGVQIKQNFFSSNYGDVGYLFLIVDLNNVEEPIIHVRTWQPEITINDSLYDLSNFN